MNVFNNVVLARNRQLPDDDRMIEICRSIFKSFNINNLSVCIGWCTDQIIIIIIIIIITAIGLLPGGSGYFKCIQDMKLVTTEFKSGGLHEKHVVATWNLGSHLSVCL